MKNNTLVEEYIRRITRALLDAGISSENVASILEELDETIHTQISDELINTLSEEEREELDLTDDSKLSDKDFMELLGVSEKDVTDRYLHKLEEYLAELPQNLPLMKIQQKK